MSRSSLQREGKRGGLSFLAAKIDEKHRLKEAVGNHRTGLPPHLLHLFQGRPAPPYLEPLRKKKPTLPLTGIGAYTQHFEESEAEKQPPPPAAAPAGERGEEKEDVSAEEEKPKIFLNPEYALQVRLDNPTRLERLVTAKKESIQQHKAALEAAMAEYNPSQDPNIQGDPLKTLFLGRLAEGVSERKLRREFEEFGPIKRIQIIHDKKTAKPCGYAFIEYEEKSDMKEAYKCTDGMSIEGKRVVVDVERGRSVPGWLPRRLGGGRGGDSRKTRLAKDPVKRRIKALVNQLAGVEDDTGAGCMEDDRDRDGGGSRYRDRDRERDRDRGRRDRNWGRDVGRRRDRRDRDDYYYSGGGGRRDRDSRKRDRSRGYDDYEERGGYGGGGGSGRDYGGEMYNTVPPPGTAMMYPPPPLPPGGGMVDDEPEEGEFVEVAEVVEEGEREAKRPRALDDGTDA